MLRDDLDAYQAQLEAVRMAFSLHWADEECDLLLEDLDKARGVLEVAWLEHLVLKVRDEPVLGRKRMTINVNFGAFGPFLKAITPALLALLTAGGQVLVNGKVDQQTLTIAITGVVAAIITYLVPNVPKAAPAPVAPPPAPAPPAA